MPSDEKKKEVVGRVIAVQGPVVDVKFDAIEDLPNVYGILEVHTVDGTAECTVC